MTDLSKLSLADLSVIKKLAYEMSINDKERYAYWDDVEKKVVEEAYSRIVAIFGEPK